MKKLRYFLLPVLLFFAVSLLTGCVETSGTSANVKPADNILRVGVSTNAPPLIYKEGNKITGLEADLARQFAVHLGKEVKFITVPWEKQIEYLEKGKTDIIMSGMTVTSKRAYRVNFTLPYLNSGQLMVTRLDEKNQYTRGIYSLMNSSKVIGTVENTVGDYLITKSVNGANRKKYKKTTMAISALINKEIDVFIIDAPMACYQTAMNETNELAVLLNLLSHENLAWAVAKDNTMLLEQANYFISMKNKSGELTQSVKRWIPYM